MDVTPPLPLLLVEDEALLRLLLEEFLTEAGFEVTGASSADEALTAIETGPEKFKGVITDIRLGGELSGWDVASRARKRVAAMSIVYMTGDAAHEWASKGVPNSLEAVCPGSTRDCNFAAIERRLVRTRALSVVVMEVVLPRLGWEVVVAKPVTCEPEPRMDAHENARTTPHSRMLMIERLRLGWTVGAVAEAFGVDGKTVRKWRERHAVGGAAGLRDRSSRPHRSPARLAAALEEEIETLRRQRLSGPVIARRLRHPVSTIGAVLRRRGLGRLSALDPRPPVIRYQRERPGELIHIDTKKLGRIKGIGHRITGEHSGMVKNRGIGWDVLHVAIDDASRLAYTELLPNERSNSACAFLARAIAFFGRHGVCVERAMTDNGNAYRSRAFTAAIAAAGLRHIRTRPYTPRTNGKAERFIQSSLREWAYARPFQSSDERADDLQAWIAGYNHTRPHAALGGKSPITRIAKDNLLGNDT